VAPAIVVGDEIVFEGADVSDHEVAVCICRQLELPEPESSKTGTMRRLLTRGNRRRK
jgi:hypothetical protein